MNTSNNEMIFEVKEYFTLSEKFLDIYRNKKVNWKNDLAYVTYKRSYAREKEDGSYEEWFDTVKRVVEGTYTIQLNHCKNLKLPWNAHKAQKSAQEMYRLIFEFKFTPPGRGLWTMGTDIIYKKGNMSLINCSAISTENIDTDFAFPFEYVADVSMYGVGTGFDLLGSGKVKIKEPKIDNNIHVIEDSREGWVDTIRKTISAYSGKELLPIEYDYSLIRPKGAPIKTFGGLAPGPDPLILCIKEIKSIFNGERDRDKKRFLFTQLFRELYLGLIYYPFLIDKSEGNIKDIRLFDMLISNPYYSQRGSITHDELLSGLKERQFYISHPFVQKLKTVLGDLYIEKYLPFSLVCLNGIDKYIDDDKKELFYNKLLDIIVNEVKICNDNNDNICYERVEHLLFRDESVLKSTSNELFNELIPRYGEYINSLDILDLMNIIGKCIVSGGCRRVALISLGDPEDIEYRLAKDPEYNLYELFLWRWSSNNSIVGDENTSFEEIAYNICSNGEPGVNFTENARAYGRTKDGKSYKDYRVNLVNPCGEISLEHGECCNLVETFPSNHETIDEYLNTLKYAYLYSKTVTLVPSHRPEVNSVMLRNRRIGLSQSGIIQSFEKRGRRTHLQWSENGYEYLKKLDKKYSEWLCIPESIKLSTIKPSGTVSLIAGATPGIHYPHSEYYLRTIRIQPESPLIKILNKANYRMETSVYGDNSTVVYFPIKEENFSRSKKDVSVWEQVENAALMQHYFSDNQVSITVTFDPETEGKYISSILEIFSDRLKSISFLPLTKHQYPQAPYQEVTKEEYEQYVSTLKPIDLSKMKNKVHDLEEKFCDGEACSIV